MKQQRYDALVGELAILSEWLEAAKHSLAEAEALLARVEANQMYQAPEILRGRRLDVTLWQRHVAFLDIVHFLMTSCLATTFTEPED